MPDTPKQTKRDSLSPLREIEGSGHRRSKSFTPILTRSFSLKSRAYLPVNSPSHVLQWAMRPSEINPYEPSKTRSSFREFVPHIKAKENPLAKKSLVRGSLPLPKLVKSESGSILGVGREVEDHFSQGCRDILERRNLNKLAFSLSVKRL